MFSPLAHTVPETIIPTNKVRDSPVITPFHDDHYMLVRQTYTPVATNTEFESLKDPIETEETQTLSPRTTPLSPDYTPASPNYTIDTPHSDAESKPIEAPETRIASPSDSTLPLPPDHLLTRTSPTPTPSRAFYYRSNARMVEPEDEGLSSEGEEATSEQQQQAVLVEDTTMDEPLGLGYKASRRRTLELAKDPVPSQDIIELYDRSAAAIGEIHSQHFRLGSLKRGQEQATITFGAL
ncbi:hypothetical protein Tco_1291551 [Tanacetum coccineum]